MALRDQQYYLHSFTMVFHSSEGQAGAGCVATPIRAAPFGTSGTVVRPRGLNSKNVINVNT